MKVIIVGAGLGGLLCAIHLRKLGYDVHVFERRQALSAAGGVITFSGSASRILKETGFDENYARVCEGVGQTIRRDIETGQVLQAVSLKVEDKFANWSASRPDLITLFYDHAIGDGAQVYFGAKIIDTIDHSDTPCVVLEDGTTHSADLVIAAEGASSPTRHRILAPYVSDPKSLDPILSTRVNYIATYDNLDWIQSNVSCKDPRSNKGNIMDVSSALQFYTGSPSRFIISLYQSTSNTFNILFANTETDVDMTCLYDQQGDLDHLKKNFYDISHAHIQRALDKATGLQRWHVAEIPSLPRWRSASNRIILLGDAAHAMHPSAGHGFSSIVSDIAVLRLILSRCCDDQDPRNIGQATQLWEEACRPRDERIKEFSRFQTAMLEGDLEAVAQKRRQVVHEPEKLKKQASESGQAIEILNGVDSVNGVNVVNGEQERNGTNGTAGIDGSRGSSESSEMNGSGETNRSNGTDGLAKDSVKSGMHADFSSAEFMHWFRRYDAVAEADQMLRARGL